MPQQTPVRQGNFSSNLNQQLGQQNQAAAETLSGPQRNAMLAAKAQMMSQPLQNTPQAMATMKGMAQLVLSEMPLNEQETALLQNFVNGEQPMMNEKDARQLQFLLRLCQQNIPASVQQAAVQQNMPDLPRLWAFMQLCDMTVTKQMNARELKKASKDVAEFVATMRHSMSGSNSAVPGQRSLNFMMPLYMGDGETQYPTYIHVYDEDKENEYTGELQKETWLRLCVLTDNIGAVELTCRVYDQQRFDMRLFFSNSEVANEFRGYVPEIREAMNDYELRLNELKVGAVGERRFI